MRSPRPAVPWVRALAGLAAIAITVGGCKPSGEDPRRATVVLGTLDGPDVGPPPARETSPVMVADAVAALGGRNAPPVVGEVVRHADDAVPAIAVAPEGAPVPDADAGAVVEDAEDAETATADEAEAPADVGIADEAAPIPVVLPGFDGPIDDEVRAALEPARGQGVQEEARALNKSGLEKHKKKLYDEAVADYLGALHAWPGHVYSRYNLACALTLEGRLDEALGALQVLSRMAETVTPAADRLKAARTDRDFEPLRKDPRFRQLTGATDVTVAWAREEDRPEAKRLAEVLRTARWSARAGSRAWNALEAMPREPTVLFRPEDPVAARSARDVAAALGVDGVRLEPAGPLPPEAPPIVVWLGGGGAEPRAESPEDPDAPGAPDRRPAPTVRPDDGPDAGPAPAPPAPPAPGPAPELPRPEDDGPGRPASELRELKDFIGTRVYAGSGAERATFELKPTGFFLWEETRASGEHTKRSGRFQVRAGALALTFKETVTTPIVGEPARVEVREAQSAVVTAAVPEPGVLTIDRRAFRPRNR